MNVRPVDSIIVLAEAKCASNARAVVARDGEITNAVRLSLICGHETIMACPPSVLTATSMYHGPLAYVRFCPMCEHFEP